MNNQFYNCNEFSIKCTQFAVSFERKISNNPVVFKPEKAGTYLIIKDESILGIVEVIDNLDSTKLEDI